MAPNLPRHIEYRAIDQIVPATRNAKGHNNTVIAGSIDRLGFLDPMIEDGRTGRLVAGHGRLENLQARHAAGDPAPDGVQVRDGTWYAPVTVGWSSRDDTQAEAAGLVLNRAPERGGWIDPTLAAMLTDQPDTSWLGWNEPDLAALLARTDDSIPGLDSPDVPGELAGPSLRTDVPSPSPEPTGGPPREVGVPSDPALDELPEEVPAIIQSGDVWLLGDHRLHCGECEPVLGSIDPASIALLLADPPYGVNERTDRRSKGRGTTGVRRGSTLKNPETAHSYNFAPVYRDDEPFDPQPLLVFPRVALFGANYFAAALPLTPSWIVWDKLAGMTSDKREVGVDDNADCELAWTNLGGPARLISHRWKGVVKGSEHGQARQHPTQKPIELMRRIIVWRTNPGDLVLDPYAGSGPVLLAAEITGRRCVAVEYVPRYCDVIARRWQQLTGQMPARESGEPVDFIGAAAA